MNDNHFKLPVIPVLIALSACSTGPSRPSEDDYAEARRQRQTLESAGALTGREAADYRQIQKAYSMREYDAAIKRIAWFEKKYPSSERLAQVRNYRGLVHMASRQYDNAAYMFQRAIEASGNRLFNQYLLYNLASAQFELTKYADTQQTLSEIRADNLDRETRIKFHTLRTRLYQKLGIPAEAVREQLMMARMMISPADNAAFAAQIEQNLMAINDPGALESIYGDYEDAPLVDLVLFRLGIVERANGMPEQSKLRFKLLLDRYPRSKRFSDARDMLQAPLAVANIVPVDSSVVGVLLPMKGKFADYGRQCLRGIELAFRIFNPEEPDTKVTLAIEDSGETGEQAVKALETLYSKHKVIGVIGPIMSKGVDLVTQKAQEFGLPILTLSQQPGVPGRWIFPAGLTMKLQTHEIARHAVQHMGYKRFAIMYPRDRYGEQYAQSFWDAVEALGGKITGIESYPPGETDFRQMVDKLSGLYYTEARSRELEALAKERELNNIKKKTRKTEQYYNLQPVVDYDAVFIPDDAQMAGQAFPTFAYRDVDKVTFLGTANWNSPELVERAQNSAENAVFVDAFNIDGTAAPLRKFIDKFRTTFDTEPASIEALAYDAASLFYYALSHYGSSSRETLRDDLGKITNYPGVTGRITYVDGHFLRMLAVLTVKGGKIVEAR
ncbi:MAG: hypothetical protein A2583_01695 [Bdellovibrionales bacterium RIFOXYD1_FULL_53_11]|nr:MAG: hypothetical protein A2583_01695 [Bdellovibrionales bacterium RIFOXYD1_FULL_53_11]